MMQLLSINKTITAWASKLAISTKFRRGCPWIPVAEVWTKELSLISQLGMRMSSNQFLAKG
jgi:hypothetical protein